MLQALLLAYLAGVIGCYLFGFWYLRRLGCTLRELLQLCVIGLVPIANFWLLYVGISEVIEDSGILDRKVF